MTKDNADTRLALLRAAERLFAANGVDAVSLRAIAREAEQGNHSAVLYHFANKRALLNAVLERHSDPIQVAWLATVTHLAAERRDELEELVGLMVRSLVDKLDDPDGGREYLGIVAELVTSRSFPLHELPAVAAPGIMALSGAMMRHIGPVQPALIPLRMMRVAAVLYCSIADYVRLTTAGMPIPREAFVADLIGSLVGLLREGSADPLRRGRNSELLGT